VAASRYRDRMISLVRESVRSFTTWLTAPHIWNVGPIPGFLVLVGAIGLFFVGVAGEAAIRQPCTAAQPCLPEPIGFTSFGLLLATVVAAFVHRAAARWLSLTFAVVFLLAGYRELPQVWWLQAYAVAFVLLCWFVLRPEFGLLAMISFEDVSHSARLPRPADLARLRPRPSQVWLVVAFTVVALTGAATYSIQQAAAQAREAAARVVSGQVIEHEDFGILVSIDGVGVPVDVLYPSDYPLGSTQPLWVDDEGLAQPLSEPYDASWWMILTGLGGGLAFAVGWRAAGPELERRRLFTRAQPVRRVSAILAGGRVTILPPEGYPEGMSLPLSFPAVTSELDSVARALAGKAPELVRTVTLYGVPEEGRWCGARLDNQTVAPTGPAEVSPLVGIWEVLDDLLDKVEHMSRYAGASPDVFGGASDRAHQRLAELLAEMRELRDNYPDQPSMPPFDEVP
jgi:hypothetical protein